MVFRQFFAKNPKKCVLHRFINGILADFSITKALTLSLIEQNFYFV